MKDKPQIMLNLKSIHIGSLIEKKWKEKEISVERTCNFIKCKQDELEKIFASRNMTTDKLLRWSKLLEYDFFRLYSQHLILYAPPSNNEYNSLPDKKKSSLPEFRKNIYTKEVIDFIVELIITGKKTKAQVIKEYRIPKTTLYKWILKYNTPKE